MVWQFPDTPVIADSRANIGSFARMMIKPNAVEAVRAIYPDYEGEIDLALIEQVGHALRERVNDTSVFITVGEHGTIVFDDSGVTHVPAVQVGGLIDTVGAGDSSLAAITAALCAGATPAEAAQIGNLAAAVTIQQIGTTGTASVEQILAIAQA
jgi:sugar/nucleoside kinase (ribokinase family)